MLQDIRGRRRYFKGQYDPKNIGGDVKNRTNDSAVIANPESVTKNQDKYDVNGHKIEFQRF